MEEFFKLKEHGTTVRQEIIAGATTFVTMAYIIIVNPKILEAAGMPFGASMVATILTAFIGTLLMGLYAKRPFAIAPYMGENAFIAFTVVKVMGFSWQQALGAIFISGAIFAVLVNSSTAARLRGTGTAGFSRTFSSVGYSLKSPANSASSVSICWRSLSCSLTATSKRARA